MESEQSLAPCGVSSMGSSNPNPNPTTSTSTSRPTVPQISVYSGIPDRQTVQVIQQALNRQPSTAAQYLQQMYAAQQQHLMLQTAALQQQQQQLSTAQLQSLAAVQQASLAVGRQNSSQSGTSTQQTGSAAQTTINLATSPAAAQLISRAQSVSSAPAGITQQAVLLGNTSSPTLTASQAQMYLRAQMLIFTPTATVTTVQPDGTAPPAGQAPSAQVQNLALRSQQGVPSVPPAQPQIQGLSLKQTPTGPQLSLSGLAPSAAQLKTPGGPQGSGTGAKNPGNEAPAEGAVKKGDGPSELVTHVVSVSRNVTAVTNHHLITPAYTQIQPHQLLQQHSQQQFVIQQQPQLSQRSTTPLLQPSPIQNQNPNQNQAHLQLPTQALPIQPGPASQCPVPVLPKPPVPAHQATIFHSTIASPQAPPKAQPVQLTAVNLQIQPATTPTALQTAIPAPTPPSTPVPTLAPSPATRTVQDGPGKDQPTSLAVSITCPSPSSQHLMSATPQGSKPSPEQIKSGSSKQRPQEQDSGAAEGVNAKPAGGRHSAMTSGNGNNRPAVAGSTPQNGETKPPQAIVKPQILTHVIEGFVIQEGAEPFPVERPTFHLEKLKKQRPLVHSDSEKLLQNNGTATPTPTPTPTPTDTEMEDLSQREVKDQEPEPMLKCELCGLEDFASNFKRSKRFCSTVCAKRYSVRCSKRMGLIHPDRSKMEKQKRGRPRSSSTPTTETKKQVPPAPPPVCSSCRISPAPSPPQEG
ncbi:hypothetical protein GJAV_G00189900 [Gymnothorax javanicus]|nr:hypothetical protein GJAV_G00189900 [Gymnothorax javanicus]